MPKGCRVAVVTNDALGNYVAATPLLQMLSVRLSPSVLDYYGGVRTAELWEDEALIDWGFPLFGSAPSRAIEASTRRMPYDLVVNVESSDWAKSFAACIASQDTFVVGPCLADDGRKELPFADDPIGRLAQDRRWASPDLTTRFPFLRSGFIGEIFCRLAYLEGEIPRYKLSMKAPRRAIPDVLIATAASLADKLWTQERWRETLVAFRERGMSVGLLGAKPSDQRRYWEGDSTEEFLVGEGLAQDLRGALRLPEVVGALSQARIALTIDNGIMHLACATRTPVVGLFREGIHRLWAPPVDNLSIVTPEPGRSVATIEVSEVMEAVDCALSAS